MKAFTVREIMHIVAEAHWTDAAEFVGFRSQAAGREMAALLCRDTGSTLTQLSEAFGLGHTNGSANLVRRAKTLEEKPPRYRCQLKEIEARLNLKTENQV